MNSLLLRLYLPTLLFIVLNLPVSWAWAESNEPDWWEQELWLPSRGIEIPASLVLPLSGPTNQAIPLVVLVHGHGGNRQENGAFLSMATSLARQGIASIRMDFPGCGESTEEFTANTLSNMLSDLHSARDYALAQPGIDANRIGLLGYSMGGRLALLAAGETFPYPAIVLWAPVASNGAADMFGFFAGAEAYAEMRAEAEASGAVLFTTPWGLQQDLSFDWFTELENSQPLEAIANYSGDLLILHGSNDLGILPTASEPLVDAAPHARVQRQLLAGAGHGMGFYGENPEIALQVIQISTEFFVRHLAGY